MLLDETYLQIDLDVIDENFRIARNLISGKVLTIVKANAYGYGAIPLAKHLEDRSDFFGVAYISEAIELRHAGIRKPILVLGHTPREAYSHLIRWDIRPTLFRLDDAIAFDEMAAKRGVYAPCHLAVDTGMHRIGFSASPEGIDQMEQVYHLKNIYVEGIFSHYANADEQDVTYSALQSEAFNMVINFLSDRRLSPGLTHMSNSAGILSLHSRRYDMTRLGVVIHGIFPSSQVPNKEWMPIRPALSWHSRITLVKDVPERFSIGYGCTYSCPRDSRIATVPVGYADGYRRSLSNKFYVLIHGKRAPIVGRVCMDQLMVDVTDIPEAQMEDEVVLIGRSGDEEITMEAFCEAAGVVHYEFMCSLNRRLPRYYTKGGKVVETLYYLPED